MVLPLDAIKLVLISAGVWAVVSIFSVILLSSLGFERQFVRLRPAWPFLALVALVWIGSLRIAYSLVWRGTFYGAIK